MLRRACMCLAAAVVSLGLAACGGEERGATSAFPDSLVNGEVVAVVNEKEITARDLRVFMLTYVPTAADSLYDRIFNLELLSGYIDRMLLGQEAAAAGVFITDSTVAWYVQRMAEAMRSRQTIDQHLASLGLTRADFERTVRRDLMVRSLIENRIAADITVDEADVRAYYEANRDRYLEQYGETEGTFEKARGSIEQGLRRRALAAEMGNHLRRNRAVAIIEPRFDVGGLTQRESTTFTR